MGRRERLCVRLRWAVIVLVALTIQPQVSHRLKCYFGRRGHLKPFFQLVPEVRSGRCFFLSFSSQLR